MQVLVLHTSLRDSDSASRSLVTAYLQALLDKHPEASITVRDLAAQPVLHLSAEMIPVQLGSPQGASKASQLADDLITELEQADIVIVGVAFYNFMISSSLKAWSDLITRKGRTFAYGAEGPVGLLPSGKKVIAFMASGGVYSSGPAQQMDLAIPYLKAIFGFVGIRDVVVVRAEAQADPVAGPASLETALVAARQLA